MSRKWNNKQSHPIWSLSEKERKDAIKEWAEGDKELEEFLWLCYMNDVETAGCCAHIKYVDFRLSTSDRKYILRVLRLAEMECSEPAVVFMPYTWNVRSSSEWYRDSIGVRGTEDFFKKLLPAFDNERQIDEEGCFEKILPLCEFLVKKHNDIRTRIEKRTNNQYIFSLEMMNPRMNHFFKMLYDSTKLHDIFDGDFDNYTFEMNGNFEEVTNAIFTTVSVFEKKWPEDDLFLADKAIIMREHFGTSPEGIKKFYAWAKKEYNM